MSDQLEEIMQERIKAAKEILPLGDMNWLELRRINDKISKIMSMMPHERKIVEYKVICGLDSADNEPMPENDLTNFVNQEILLGFVPFGNPWVCSSGHFYQALVKYDN